MSYPWKYTVAGAVVTFATIGSYFAYRMGIGSVLTDVEAKKLTDASIHYSKWPQYGGEGAGYTGQVLRLYPTEVDEVDDGHGGMTNAPLMASQILGADRFAQVTALGGITDFWFVNRRFCFVAHADDQKGADRYA